MRQSQYTEHSTLSYILIEFCKDSLSPLTKEMMWIETQGTQNSNKNADLQ